MNINNIFGGILGFMISLSLLYLFWSPITSFIDLIPITELKVFVAVAWVCFGTILGVIAPMNLATSDDTGSQ